MTATVEVHLRKRFQCSACGKSAANKKPIRDHIDAGCVKDPDTRACGTCAHQVYRDFTGWGCLQGVLEALNDRLAAALDADPHGVGDDEFPTLVPGADHINFVKRCDSWRLADHLVAS